MHGGYISQDGMSACPEKHIHRGISHQEKHRKTGRGTGAMSIPEQIRGVRMPYPAAERDVEGNPLALARWSSQYEILSLVFVVIGLVLVAMDHEGNKKGRQ